MKNYYEKSPQTLESTKKMEYTSRLEINLLWNATCDSVKGCDGLNKWCKTTITDVKFDRRSMYYRAYDYDTDQSYTDTYTYDAMVFTALVETGWQKCATIEFDYDIKGNELANFLMTLVKDVQNTIDIESLVGISINALYKTYYDDCYPEPTIIRGFRWIGEE